MPADMTDAPSPRCSSGTREPPTQEFTLRAMAANYAGGSRWDHLDLETCIKAADEIKALRSGDAYRSAWLELIERCNVLKEENYQLRHPSPTPQIAPKGWRLVPERAVQQQMDAGLYQSSADSTWADVYSTYADMIDAAPSPDDHPDQTKPVAAPAGTFGVAQRPVICGQDTIRTAAKALDYLADHTRPAGGQETYNAEHLIQIAYELREIANASPPAALPAETVTVPLEALRNCGCPADFRATVGQCEDSGQCGCSINLKGRAVSSTDRGGK